jgi:hypothetical protein
VILVFFVSTRAERNMITSYYMQIRDSCVFVATKAETNVKTSFFHGTPLYTNV